MQNVSDIHRSLSRSIEEYRGRQDPEAVKAVAKEMEALFAYEMIKVMRETTGASSTGALGGDAYTSMFDMELSRIFAERGLGLRDMLATGLKNVAKKAENPPTMSDRQTIKSVGKKTPEPEVRSLLPNNNQTRISSGYGLRHDPFSGDLKFHYGVDIPASVGTDIHPVRKGTVVFSGEQHGYGNVVIIDHGEGFQSKYAHNQTNLVQEGQVVDTGSIIAQVGSTGKSTGPHVHFEVLFKGKPVDPDLLLAQR